MLASDTARLSTDFTSCLHVDRLAIDDLGPPIDHLRALFLQKRSDAASEPSHDAIFPAHRFAGVEGRPLHADAECSFTRVAPHVFEFCGHMDQRFRWNATDVQARATEVLAFD